MAAPSANVTVQVGNIAAVNVNNGGTVYADPGSALTLALQSSTGVQYWAASVLSDYAPMNGQTFLGQGSNMTMQSIALPQTPCKLTVTSEVTDGNNLQQISFVVYNYQRVSNPIRAVRCVQVSNQNLANVNTLITIDGCNVQPGDRVLAVGQTLPNQNGPYVMTANVANVATWVRPPDYLTGQAVLAPVLFEVTEGTTYAGTTWKDLSNTTGTVTIDTTNVTFYPKTYIGALSNIANSKTLTANFFISTTAVALCVSTNTTNAVQTTTINSGIGNGNVTFACTSANDHGQYIIMNW